MNEIYHRIPWINSIYLLFVHFEVLLTGLFLLFAWCTIGQYHKWTADGIELKSMISQLSVNAGNILDLAWIQEIILCKHHFDDENIYGQLILLGIMSDHAF